MLYEYCAARRVAYARCGKLLVATAAHQVPQLEAILALQADAGRDGAMIAPKSPVESIDAPGSGFTVKTAGDAPIDIRAACVVNRAGLTPRSFARRIRGLDAHHVPPLYLVRGNYFSVSARVPFTRLI